MGPHGQFMRRVRRTAITLLAGVLVVTAPTLAQAAEASDPEPLLGGQLYSTGTAVTVEVLPASAGLTSTLFLLDPEEVPIATNRDVGTTRTVGPYGVGTELVFGIRVGGQEFRLGPGGRNPDGIPHAVVDFGADGCAVVGFEDLFGGGDRDYDDNKFKFCGGIAPEVPEDPEEPPTPDPVGPPVANAGTDQQVDEGSTVTLDASGSRASTRPALQASEQQGTLPGGTSVGAALDGLDDDATGIRVDGSVSIGQGPAAQNTSIAYVIDVSGSAGSAGGPCGDVNADRRSNTILDCELAAALKLQEEVEAAGTVDKVAVITFSSGASALDLDPTSATATLVSPAADKDGNGVTDVVQAIKRVGGAGGTNFIPPVQVSCQLLATTGSPNLVTAFMSDGQGSGSLKTVLPCNPPVTFHAFAVGSGSRCNSGSAVGSRLIDMATLSGGTCTDVPTVSDLPDILPQVVGSKLTGVSYTVDGGDPVDLGATLDLPVAGPADLDVAFDLPAGLAAGSHRICLTVTAEDSGGSSSETTCSDLVTVTGAVAYSWRLDSRQGPPVFLSSRTAAKPTFVAPDDGTYVFELTVTDGTGGTATDEVVVVVENLAPLLTLSHGDSFAGGVTQVNATLTDEGWLDTHGAVVDWGDGTTAQVDVTTAGAGWGTFFASHVYRRTGAFDVVVTLSDDDGGTAVRRVDHLEVTEPTAVWANSTAGRSLDWAGGSGEISGRVHTNGELRFVGASKTVKGGTTYAGSLAADTTRNSFLPLPVKSAVAGFPISPRVADFRPGGPVAVEVGSAYHDMSALCSGGSWHDVQSTLPSGVYYASCDIQLNGSQIGGRVTLVSEGHIKIAGSRPAFEPYRDGLLLLAGATGSKAIDIATSSSKFLGVLFAGSGQVSISGGANRFYCGILGDTVSISGTDVTVRGADCGRPDRTVSGPVVVPDLTAEMTVDRELALPGDRLGYDVTVTNRGTTLVVPSLIGLENVDTTGARVVGHDFTVERQVATTGQWVPVATLGDPSMAVHVRPNPFEGVQYAAGGAVVGTTVAPGGWATWGVQAELSLTPAQVSELLDENRTSGVRTRVDFTLDPSAVQARRLYTYGSDFSAQLRALGADATGVAVTAILPDGDAAVITAAESDPDWRIAPGASVTRHREWTVPVPAARVATETDAGYLSRLAALDGTQLNGAAYAQAVGGVGRLVAPLMRVTTTRELPVVGVSTVGSAAMPAGTSGDYDLRLANLGSADASALAVAATADTAALPVTGAPTALDAGELATARTSYSAPAASSGSVVLRGTAAWKDARGNVYGLSGSDLVVARQLPAVLSASLVDTLVGDVAGDGAVSPGDTVRYTLTVANRGGLTLRGVSGRVPVPANATVVAGSGAVPDGGSVSLAGGEATFSLPDIAGAASRRLVFDVVVAQPFPAGVARLEAQGTVSATGVDTVPTDDPALPGSADPTRTTVTRPTPALTASLTGRLVIDADGSGGVSAGDTLAYDLTVSSVGTQQVTGIHVAVPAPAGTSVVADSVRTSQGTLTAGPGVGVDLGTLAPFQQATVDFRLKVAAPLPAGTTSIRTVGAVTSDQLDPIQTDDPQTVTVGDGTDIPIGDPGANPEVPGATLGAISPTDGAMVTAPTRVTTAVTPPDGTTVTSWRVDLVPTGESSPTTIGSGTSGPVDVLLDPTVLPNGAYDVVVRVVTSNGGVTTERVTVVVDGELKLGRFTTTYSDLTVDVAGMPVDVQRTYDSFDKRTGDFGVGWDLDLADFRVAANGPLGAGGWSMASCGSGLIFVPLCFTSAKAHFVTVTWPDGRNEVFDLTPAKGSTFFSGLTTAEFTARSGTGTTSTLSAPDNSLFYGNGNLNGGAFGTDGTYDPQRFVLTDRFGTKYSLVVGEGLRKVEDRTGASVTVSETGISSSSGPVVSIDRDAAGRIRTVTDPDGKVITYRYDAAGDLVEIIDRDGTTIELRYRGNHYLESVSPSGQAPLRTMGYGADGRLETITDGEGNTVTVEADLGARTETVSGPDPRLTTRRFFDPQGNTTRIDEIFGGRTLTSRYTYDDLGLVEESTDPLGHSSVADYDAKGNLVRLQDRDGVVTTMGYNAYGQPTDYRVDGALKNTLTYDPLTGNVDRIDYGTSGLWAEFDYDARGRLTSSRDIGGRTESVTYGPDGLPATTTDAMGTTRATWTDGGKLETVTDPAGATTRYTYDDGGRVASLTDPLGHTVRFTYDAFGRVDTETDALGKVTRHTYDAAGRLSTTRDRTGVLTTLTYAADGQVARREATDGTFTAFTYDALGRVESARNNGSTLSWTWDDASRPLTETLAAAGVAPVTLSRGWTDGGQLSRLQDPSGTTTYGYDGQGRLRSVVDSQGGTSTLAYDGLDRLTTLARPNGLTTTWGHGDGTIDSQITSSGQQVVHSIITDRDAAGFPESVTDATGVHTYDHDALGRLASADHPTGSGIPDESYTYDDAGNRTSWAGNPSSAVSYDAANRLLGDGRYTYTYDDEGRMVRRTERGTGVVTRYTWNAVGDLVGVTPAAGQPVTYAYDALGRRIRTSVGSDDVRSVFADDNPVLRYDDAGELVSRTVNGLGADGVLAQVTDGTASYPIADPSGSVVATTDASGTVAETYAFDSFGNPASGTSAAGGWHGFDRDPTGMYDARARTYDPGTGRFLSQDPLPAENLYPYAVNSPLRVNDPSGQTAMAEYGMTTQNSSRNALTICTQGSFWSSMLMDTALEIGLAAAGVGGGPGGLYAFWDEGAKKPYVGRSVDLMRRLNEHLRAGRITDKSTIHVLTGLAKDALPQAEQLAIRGCNGGDVAKGGANVLANKINAINKSRRDALQDTLQTLLGL